MSSFSRSGGPIIDVSEFGSEIGKLIDEAKQGVREAIEDGLDEATEILIDALAATSPQRTGAYANSWRLKYPRGKYARRRYVHNPTMVMYKGKKVPLAAFIEYAAHGRPHIAKTVRNTRGQAIAAIEKHLKQNI